MREFSTVVSVYVMVECKDALTVPAIWSFPVLSGHLVLSPPPPHTGPALISALNILEGFNLTSLVSREQALHWVAEVRPTPPFNPMLGDTESWGLGYCHGAGLNPLQIFSHTRILGVGTGRKKSGSLCYTSALFSDPEDCISPGQQTGRPHL